MLARSRLGQALVRAHATAPHRACASTWSAGLHANGRVVVLTADAPPVNPMNDSSLDAFASVLDGVQADPRTRNRPLVLAASPASKAFSAGLDLPYLFGLPDRAESRARTDRVLRKLGVLLQRVLAHPAPTVAALHGHALAGGAILAFACDFRVAAAAPFHVGAIEVPVGVPFPATPFEIIRRAFPPSMQADALLMGRRWTPEELAAAGLVAPLVHGPYSELLDAAAAKASELPDTSLPAFALTKAMLVEPSQRYCAAHEENALRASLDALFSDAGWAHIQGTLAALGGRGGKRAG
eukprot:CAMPEP_0177677230 /NCGR_PEP_ID=MMETSP0447-20121125/28263_1 /TAXON_ID=0 /ORGANISM="Stygamoeba regulata, Strain BSH-02190019" /LENGTH=295 /DNA_ID=CAMNT_0019185949 /DNA_START=23 /DNA_END=910 /DNA_ORIENTATION=+